MKAPWYMKISFKEKQPVYKGFIKGGWIKIPPNKKVGLPCFTWASLHPLYRAYLFLVFLSRLRIVRK